MDSIHDSFDEIYTKYSPKVNSVIYKYVGRGLKQSDVDDVRQEIWSEIWEIAAENGKYPTTQIPSIAQHKIVDFIRKDMTYNKYSPWGIGNTQRVPYYGTGEDDSDEQPEVSGVYADPNDRFKEIEQEEDFREFLDQYPEGSKERTYIEYYLDKGYDKKSGKRYTDGELAQLLGWSGTSSMPWKKFKAKMQQEIADYFGYEPEEKVFASRGRTQKKD